MYSRDIFPKYSAESMSLPAHYSGNAFRPQPPTPPTPSGSPPGNPKRPLPRPAPSPPLKFPVPVAPREATPPPESETPTVPVPDDTRDSQSTVSPAVDAPEEQDSVNIAAMPAQNDPPPERRTLFSNPAMKPFLPPKPDISHIFGSLGIEDALLLGLILLLSQNEGDDETLALLALLFLYK